MLPITWMKNEANMMTHAHPPSGAKDVSREDFVSVMSRVSLSIRPYIPLIRKRNCSIGEI